MMGGLNIEAAPSSRKIYYTAINEILPEENSLGSKVQLNKYNASTKNGVLVTVNDITNIGEKAFYREKSITSVTIPDSVTSIGNWAFCDCSGLTSVYCKATIPPSLEGADVFDFNDSDRKIYVPAGSVLAYRSAVNWSDYALAIVGYDFEKGEIDIPSHEIWYTSYNGNIIELDNTDVFGANITSNTYTDGKGIITFDGNVKRIGSYAFRFTNIVSITIPKSVTSIDGSAFDTCTNITSITIPDSVRNIGDSAFHKCRSLASITIGSGVGGIGQYAFRYCTGLTSITIPDSINVIGNYAFQDCSSLISIYCKSVTPPTLSGYYVFEYNANGRKIYVPTGSVDAYKKATYWSHYASAIEGYEF